ncbi:MAG TPA: ATP-binding protein [Acidimicrobiales bacterium]|jgi:serine/threonine-protein kinase RsbW|nr:ATP-binding protein [Acidimicrobiales bacterium]
MSGDTEIAGADTLSVGDRVELIFPARGDLVVLARLVASAISARAGFDIEELEDLRLAVGELCLLALQGSDDRHGDLRLEFVLTDSALDISCTLAGAAPHMGAPNAEAADADHLSEQILDALVDEHGREQMDGFVRAWMRKHRRGRSV